MASAPYLGEIRMFGGKVPPAGWAFCDGSSLSIANNVALFSLIGTTFGGDGQAFFNLPDLRGRVFVSTDNNEYLVGQTGGAEQVSLQEVNLPAHTHSVSCSTAGSSDTPKGNTWGPATNTVYSPPASGALARAMSTLGIKPAGSGKPHENMIPFLCVNYIIALTGIFPSKGDAAGAGAPADQVGGTPDQYLSELRIFPFNFVPSGWMACNGQQLPVGPNQALYALLGITYGGNASFFNLPNLVARVPVHAGDVHTLGQTGGEATHVLSIGEMPSHTHQAQASSSGPATGLPTNAFWASNTGVKPYGSPPGPLMSSQAINAAGNNVGHENRSPFVVLNICIAVVGIFPSKN
jgi:microcystin-dependent protein